MRVLLICGPSPLPHTQTPGVFWGTFNQPRPFHDVRGGVRLLNNKTIQLENFSYDGGGFGELSVNVGLDYNQLTVTGKLCSLIA